jgi:hypothetical protein
MGASRREWLLLWWSVVETACTMFAGRDPDHCARGLELQTKQGICKGLSSKESAQAQRGPVDEYSVIHALPNLSPLHVLHNQFLHVLHGMWLQTRLSC